MRSRERCWKRMISSNFRLWGRQYRGMILGAQVTMRITLGLGLFLF